MQPLPPSPRAPRCRHRVQRQLQVPGLQELRGQRGARGAHLAAGPPACCIAVRFIVTWPHFGPCCSIAFSQRHRGAGLAHEPACHVMLAYCSFLLLLCAPTLCSPSLAVCHPVSQAEKGQGSPMSLRRGGRAGISPTAATGLLLPRPGRAPRGERMSGARLPTGGTAGWGCAPRPLHPAAAAVRRGCGTRACSRTQSGHPPGSCDAVGSPRNEPHIRQPPSPCAGFPSPGSGSAPPLPALAALQAAAVAAPKPLSPEQKQQVAREALKEVRVRMFCCVCLCVNGLC